MYACSDILPLRGADADILVITGKADLALDGVCYFFFLIEKF
jgi:hypothetical protein